MIAPRSLPLLLLLAACGSATDPGAETDSQVDGAVQAEPEGRFRPVRVKDDLTAEQREKMKALEAIGYSEGTMEGMEGEGVLHHDATRAQAGLNFLTSGHFAGALLMDMGGEVLHEWRRTHEEVWPEDPVPASNANRTFWRKAKLLPDGAVIAIFEGIGIVKFDRSSRVLWALRNRAHHDLEILPNGEILVLTRIAHVMPQVHPTEPTLEDFVTRLSPEGEELSSVSVLECFENGGLRAIWRRSKMPVGDILHTNTLHLIDETEARLHDFLEPGMVLVASPRVDLVGLLDLEKVSLERYWRTGFVALHDPNLRPDGSILLFDNVGAPRKKSRAMAFDPVSGETVWQYLGEADDPLFSKTCGTATELPGGTTLVVESDNGRALEVTAEGEVVWLFHSPWRVGPDRGFVATLFDVERLPLDAAAWLER